MNKRILFSLLTLCFVLCFAATAAALDTVYINDAGTGDGASAEAPLGDIAKAIELLEKGGTIKVVDTYTLLEPFIEPAHTGVITITGGKLVFNHNAYSRYYMSGPVTFKSITLVRGELNAPKGAMILARFNPLVIDTGVSFSGFSNFLITGGVQFPTGITDPTERNLDTHITINSGNITGVIGFSRGNGAETYSGTAHITVNGGTVKNLYGSSVSGCYSGSAEITVNGGTVQNLLTAGDGARRLNGDATVTVTGGTVQNLTMNNVMGKTEIRFLGGIIGALNKKMDDTLVNKVTDGTFHLVARRGVAAHEYYEMFDTATYEDGSSISGAADAEVAVYSLLDKKPEKCNATMAKIYVSNAGNGDGLTPETAISDLGQAYEMLEGVDGTIVLINTIDLSKANFVAPEHDNKIVITSYDGERYFDGGVFMAQRRFYCGGDTLFENTRIDYTTSFLIVGGFHNITMGTGLDTSDICGIYLVGGMQLYNTPDEVPHKVNGSITVESGNYYCFVGYTRGAETSGYMHEFEGKQTINFLGGKVKRIYGGPAQASIGDHIELNISGGEVTDYIQLGGDGLIYSKSATVNISGGKIKHFEMRNVINSTTVNWTGGEIESMGIVYGKNEEKGIDVSALATNAKYTLNYAGVTPTAEMLALFDTAASGTPLAKTEVKLTIGKMEGIVNGVAKALDAAPVIRNSRTMLPVRFVAENLGATVGWDGATSTVTVTTDTTKLEITIGATTAKINGTVVTLDSPAFIENSRTYLPVRFVAENLGAEVAWDGATSTATLTK